MCTIFCRDYQAAEQKQRGLEYDKALMKASAEGAQVPMTLSLFLSLSISFFQSLTLSLIISLYFMCSSRAVRPSTTPMTCSGKTRWMCISPLFPSGIVYEGCALGVYVYVMDY